MLIKLKQALGFAPTDPQVDKEMALENMRLGRLTAVIVMFFEIIMLFYYDMTHDRFTFDYYLHMGSYVFFFAASAIFAFLCTRALRDQIRSTRLMTGISIAYCIAATAWGILISAMDYAAGNQVFVFITIVLCVTGFSFFKPYISIPLHTLAFGIFYYILVLIDGARHAHFINYAILWLMMILSAVTRYHIKKDDITAQIHARDLNKALSTLSFYDELTKLKNRHCLTVDIPEFVGQPIFLAMIDLDDFKQVNDTYGHVAGDTVLTQFADLLTDSFQDQDAHVYRLGGEEFIVLAVGRRKAAWMEKIRHCLAEMPRIQLDGVSLHLTFSVGVLYETLTRADAFPFFLETADHRLYISKRNGKNRITCADEPKK